MGARRTTPSSARQRYYNRRLKRTGVLFIAALVLASVVGGALVYPVLAPDSNTAISYAGTKTATPQKTADTSTQTTTVEISPTPTEEPKPTLPIPTEGQLVPPIDDKHILYYTIAGDS